MAPSTSSPHHAADDELVETPYTEVSALQDHGISVADITKLKTAGISTIESVQATTRMNLCKIKGFSDVKVEKIKEAAGKIIQAGFLTATEVSRQREKVLSISTGCKAFDAILGGGFMTGSVSEIYGEFRCGKTQICHTLSVVCQLPLDNGGAGGKVAYIDTEGTFRPTRIGDIAQRFGVDEGSVLSNIVVGRALNSEHQQELVLNLSTRMAEEGCYRLLIIDSIISLFRVDYTGRGELSARQAALNAHLSKLTRLAEDYNVAVILVNQVSADPGAMAFQADKKPLGGHVLSHASATRVALRKGRGDERIAKIVDSPEMPEGEATYRITNGGIEDVA